LQHASCSDFTSGDVGLRCVKTFDTSLRCLNFPNLVPSSSEARPNVLGPSVLTLREQQCFVWDTTSQSTKRQDMLEIWWVVAPLPTWLRLCSHVIGYVTARPMNSNLNAHASVHRILLALGTVCMSRSRVTSGAIPCFFYFREKEA